MVSKDSPSQTSLAELGTSVSLREILGTGIRLDAAAYSLEARRARSELSTGPHALRPLLSKKDPNSSYADSAFNAFRFKRIYVGPSFGVPFLSSSDIISLLPQDYGFISRAHTKRLDELMVRPWDVLISCSGTVGNVALAPPSWTAYALSQHVIRVRARDSDTAGYIACFLRSKWGRPQLVGQSYGSVVTHIEPHHLENVLIPDVPSILKIEMGRYFVNAAQAREKANFKIHEAEEQLLFALKLPPLRDTTTGPIVSSGRCSELAGRFDASYHAPVVRQLEQDFKGLSYPIKLLGDAELALSIRGVTKFRKRVYVNRGGIPLLSSKQLFQVDPIDVNRLARGAHVHDLPEIELTENMICVTRSGTVGKVFLVPNYMDKWAGSEHLLRIVAPASEIAAYISVWLSSSYGQALLGRQKFGSVIQEIDRFQLANLPLPWIPLKARTKVAELALEANALRTSAWNLEEKALARFAEINSQS